MRDKLIHGYFSMDIDIIWDTVISEIPKVLEKIGNTRVINVGKKGRIIEI